MRPFYKRSLLSGTQTFSSLFPLSLLYAWISVYDGILQQFC